jgi:hypothetical protein
MLFFWIILTGKEALSFRLRGKTPVKIDSYPTTATTEYIERVSFSITEILKI